MAHQVGEEVAVRDFHIVDVPEEELVDLRRRILATRWPEKETVEDQSQGVPLAMIQELARYWATEYDWRKCEATLTHCRSSSPRSTGSTSTSSTSARATRTRCRSWSITDGPARSSRAEDHRSPDRSDGTRGECNGR